MRLQDTIDELAAKVLWLAVDRASVEQRACREYVVYSDQGIRLITARAFPWRREIPLHVSPDFEQPALALCRRRSFPMSGKVDVYALPLRSRIGVVSRSGRYRDAEGRLVGAFRDARTLSDHAREGAFTAVMEALLGGDGTHSAGSGPTGFVHLVAGHPAGTLARARPPFTITSSGAQPRHAATLRRILPRRVADTLFDRRPTTWKLNRTTSVAPADARLQIAAALFAVELSHW